MLKKRWVYQQRCLTATTVPMTESGPFQCCISGDSWDQAFSKSAADG